MIRTITGGLALVCVIITVIIAGMSKVPSGASASHEKVSSRALSNAPTAKRDAP